VAYYNARRPHQGIEQDSPLGLELASPEGSIRYRNVLGGIIRDYYREAACHPFPPQISFRTIRAMYTRLTQTLPPGFAIDHIDHDRWSTIRLVYVTDLA